MSCPICANNVDKQLLDVPGVEAVQVDLGTGTVNVRLSPQGRTTPAQLATAVSRSGYTLKRIDADGAPDALDLASTAADHHK